MTLLTHKTGILLTSYSNVESNMLCPAMSTDMLAAFKHDFKLSMCLINKGDFHLILLMQILYRVHTGIDSLPKNSNSGTEI